MRVPRRRIECLCTVRLLMLTLVTAVSAVAVSSRATEPASSDYGVELPMVHSLGLSGAMDATVQDGTLFVIGHGTLYVADIADPGRPRVIARLAGLGHTRQIEVHRKVAYVTAREDGLFLVDVARPGTPTLLCHYDTIELATGIALLGDVAFVACRTAGVELVDISNPRRPVHLSTVRTGEAQSVVARGRYLYAGVWGTRELVICDVGDPYRPVVISRSALDGYGDGVALHGDYCFVATGHHARGRRRRDGEASPSYGAGHGLEIFNVSDPAEPEFVSRVKTRRFYRLGMDMWDVMVAGNYAFLADTYNGVFVVDVTDVHQPRIVGHRQLPPVPGSVDGLDTGERLPAPVGGIALAEDTLYVAGAWTDLHVLAATGMAEVPAAEPGPGPRIPARRPQSVDPRFRVYRPPGQVYGVAFAGDTALVAAGAAGLHAVELWPEIGRRRSFPTRGFARDVAVCGDRVYVAESRGGLSIWRRDEHAVLAPLGRYHPKQGGVAQVVVPPPGRYALLHVGQNELQIVDVSDPHRPVLKLADKHVGLFYTFPLTRSLLDGRYASCQWHVSGFRWYDLYGGSKPVCSGDHWPVRIGSSNGMDIIRDRALAVARGKYTLVPRDEQRGLDELTFHGVPGQFLSGKPTVYDDTLYLANRLRGTVTVLDIAQIERPRLLADIQLAEHPSPVCVHNGVAVIPGGYQGLLVWDPGQRQPAPAQRRLERAPSSPCSPGLRGAPSAFHPSPRRTPRRRRGHGEE